jgi:tRNA(Arg) A34 adenosine deaminase TadA
MSQRDQGPRDAHLMGLALALAETGGGRGQTPLGAVVMDRDGWLLGEGPNTVRAERETHDSCAAR